MVDQDLMESLETAAYNAHVVWTLLEEVLLDGSEPHTVLRESLDRVKTVTARIKAHMSSNTENESQGSQKAMVEDAHTFVKVLDVHPVLLLGDLTSLS